MKIVAAAFLCVVVAASLASPHRAQNAGAAPSPTPGGVQSLNVPLTRVAYVDSKLLAEKGVKLEKNSAALADLKTFGQSLKVDIIDVGKLQAVVFIADERVDLTEAFLDAWKARPSRSAPLDVSGVNVPAAGVAVINSDAFAHHETGITKLVAAFKALEAEFKPRREEIIKLRGQLDSGKGDEKRLGEEIKRKQSAGQAALEQRVREKTASIYEDIGKALKPFCKRHGISLLFDTSRIKKTDRLPPFDLPFPAAAPDVTAAFVSAYNQGALLDNVQTP